MNIEINDLLCYASTALDSIDNNTIIINCVTFFGSAKINEAKQRLSELLNENLKWRKGNDKIKANMQDIIDLLRNSAEKGKELPKFVAESYNSLPPVSGFDSIGEYLIRLIDEVSRLNQEVSYLKEARNNELNLKNELISLKETIYNQNKTLNELKLCFKGTYTNLHKNESSQSFTYNNKETECDNYAPSAPPESQVFNDNELCELEMDNVVRSPLRLEDEHNVKAKKGTWANIVSDNNCNNKNLNLLSIFNDVNLTPKSKLVKKATNKNEKRAINSESSSLSKSEILDNVSVQDNNNEFTLVKKIRKNKTGFFGKKQTDNNCKFKSAKSYADLYIGRCDLSVTSKDIIDYLKNELDIKDCEVSKLNARNPNMGSFKIKILISEREKLLADEVWPSGIICRKFYSSSNKY